MPDETPANDFAFDRSAKNGNICWIDQFLFVRWAGQTKFFQSRLIADFDFFLLDKTPHHGILRKMADDVRQQSCLWEIQDE